MAVGLSSLFLKPDVLGSRARCICLYLNPLFLKTNDRNSSSCDNETESVYCAVRTGSFYIIQIVCFVWI